MVDSESRTVRILVVDDHTLFRESLGRALAEQVGFQVVGACASVAEALEIVSRQPVDVVLLDIDLGNEHGGEFLRLAPGRGFTGKVLVVTAGVHPWEATRLLQQGSAGIFQKQDPIEALCDHIRKLAAGDALPPPAPARPLPAPDGPLHRPLTPRQGDVLRRIFEGKTNKEIAGDLQITESLVKEILQQLFSKAGVRTRGQLVRVAIERYWDELGLR